MLAFPISAKYASTITFSCSAHAKKPLFFAPYNFNVSEPRRFSVFRKSEHKAYMCGDFSNVVPDILGRCGTPPFGTSPPAITGSEVDHAVENNQVVSAEERLKFGVKVSVDLRDDEYNLKIKRIKFSSSSDQKKEMEWAEQTAHSAGMLLLQAEMLREMGDQLLAQYRESFRSTLTN